jgi:hypothetical protein
MSDERKSKLKRGTPRVKQVRLRIMLTEMMSDFIKPRGTYETYPWKMLFHSTHVKLLGSRFCMSMIYDYAATTDGLIVCEMDYSERYQPVPMREIQSENFGKDEDVSMEIRIVTYTGRFDRPNSALTKRVISYRHISDKKPQIAATTFANTEQMFEDIHRRQELTENDYFLIILITDGCEGQYKSGTATAMFMLAMHAQATGKIFFQVVKCAGHGKCRCDAEGGCHKTCCDKFFDRHVITPEEATDGSRGVPSHKVQDGQLVSLAETVCRILNDKDYVHGALSKSNRKKKDASKVISKGRFILRKKRCMRQYVGSEDGGIWF